MELGCHPDEKISSMQESVDRKVSAMGDIIKCYKKLILMGEAEMKKDLRTNVR